MPEPRADNPPPAEMDRSIDDLLADAAADIDGDFETVDGVVDAPAPTPELESAEPSEPAEPSDPVDVEAALEDVAADLESLASEAEAIDAPAPIEPEQAVEPPVGSTTPDVRSTDEIAVEAVAQASTPPSDGVPDLDAALEQAAADLDFPEGLLDAPVDGHFESVPVGDASAHALLDADLQEAEVAHASNMSPDDLPAGDFSDAADVPAPKPAPPPPPAPAAKPAPTLPAVVVATEPKKPKKPKKSKAPATTTDVSVAARRSPVTLVTSFVFGALVEINAPVRQLSTATRDFVGIIALLTAFNAAAAWLVWLLLAGR